MNRKLFFCLGILLIAAGFLSAESALAGIVASTRNDGAAFIGPDGKPTTALRDLLALVELEHDGTLHGIVEVTEKKWRLADALERSTIQDTPQYESLRAPILKLAEQMGVINSISGSEFKYDYGIWLGGYKANVRDRLAMMARDWENGIRFKTLVVLTGDRPLRTTTTEDAFALYENGLYRLPLRRGWTPPESPPQIEYEMMMMIWDQVEIPHDMRETLEEKRVFVNAPRGDRMRATTEDAYICWIKENYPTPGTIVAYSSQPYIRYQQLAGESVLSPRFSLDTVGPQVPENISVSVILDGIARALKQYEQNSLSLRRAKS